MIDKLISVLTGKTEVEEYLDFDSLKSIKRFPEKKVVKRIRRLSEGGWGGQNAYLLTKDPVISMVPHNDGMPTCPLVWYVKNDKYVEIMDNSYDFTQIGNLQGILEQTVPIMRESYDKRKPIMPEMRFGILLKNELKPDYSGEGELVIITENPHKKRSQEDLEKASIAFANRYLDIFMGWNFGDIVKDNKELESNLLDFNQQLMKEDNRNQDKPMGFEVTYTGRYGKPRHPPIDCFYRFER